MVGAEEFGGGDVLDMCVGGKVGFFGSGSKDGFLGNLRNHAVGDAVGHLSGAFVTEAFTKVGETVRGGFGFSASYGLSLEGVSAVVAGGFSSCALGNFHEAFQCKGILGTIAGAGLIVVAVW